MCICVFANKITFRSKQIHIRRCAKEKTFAETENGDLFICLFVYSTTKSQPYVTIYLFKKNTQRTSHHAHSGKKREHSLFIKTALTAMDGHDRPTFNELLW